MKGYVELPEYFGLFCEMGGPCRKRRVNTTGAVEHSVCIQSCSYLSAGLAAEIGCCGLCCKMRGVALNKPETLNPKP